MQALGSEDEGQKWQVFDTTKSWRRNKGTNKWQQKEQSKHALQCTFLCSPCALKRMKAPHQALGNKMTGDGTEYWGLQSRSQCLSIIQHSRNAEDLANESSRKLQQAASFRFRDLCWENGISQQLPATNLYASYIIIHYTLTLHRNVLYHGIMMHCAWQALILGNTPHHCLHDEDQYQKRTARTKKDFEPGTRYKCYSLLSVNFGRTLPETCEIHLSPSCLWCGIWMDSRQLPISTSKEIQHCQVQMNEDNEATLCRLPLTAWENVKDKAFWAQEGG